MPVALEAMFQYANESESEVLTLIDSATAWWPPNLLPCRAWVDLAPIRFGIDEPGDLTTGL